MGPLMRMAAALSLALAMFGASDLAMAAEPVPLKTVRKIRAAYGPATYLPTHMARGYKFTTWRIGDDSEPGLFVDFWRGGALPQFLAQWQVYDARFIPYPCSAPFFEGTITRVINGRAVHSVYLERGGGRDTWACVRYRAGRGLVRRVQVKLYSDRLAVRTAMRIVGTTRRIP